MSEAYNPSDVEARLAAEWESQGHFKPDLNAPQGPFSIVIPPPNVTGILHMGHALNNTLQDILVRWKRMQGYSALWVPGTDHAGIATQNVVERQLAKEKITRHQLGREKFVEKVWEWKEQYGSTIVRQLRRLGSSCDWSHERFTMDEGLSKAVQHCFLELHKAGLVYRGYYLVNWCPRCQTALSDEEVTHEEVKGHLWYIKYPVTLGGEIVVATTRPETMLGDVAVAVHPDDERYKKYKKNQELDLPLIARRIKFIQDPAIDMEFGTGAVKVTPAHDPVDFLLGQKYGLEAIRVIDPDGRMNEQAGPYAGLDRFKCREKIVADLEAHRLLDKVENHKASVGHCYRCKTIIEPMLSPQWFVRMKPLAALGIEAVEKDGMRFVPERWTKVYLDWLNNIRDWCISRQIWWGHRIPAWYCKRCYPEYTQRQQRGTLSGTLVIDEGHAGIVVSAQAPSSCPRCGGKDMVQDEDVLDTWFSSWLWPFSTLGWPEQTKDLATFYPTSVLVTGQDIIFFWVARMVMAGKFFLKKIPFKDVYIHGIIRVEGGKKMSKSLGNIIDPLEIIERMGADGLRFSIAHMASEGQDLYLSENKFLIGRNFANKLWNASRLILDPAPDAASGAPAVPGQSSTLHKTKEGSAELRAAGTPSVSPVALDSPSLTVADIWILTRLEEVTASVTESLNEYRFNEMARHLYQFVWNDFCDWYLETAKLQREDNLEQTERVLRYVLERTLRLLHPIMPFITEELWRKMGGQGTISKAIWPEADLSKKGSVKVAQAIGEFGSLKSIIGAVRNIRATFRVPAKEKVKLLIRVKFAEDLFLRNEKLIKRLGQISELTVGPDILPPPGSAAAYSGSVSLFVPLAGLIDIPAERQRIQKEMESLQTRAQSKKGRLNDPTFRNKAPADVVAEEEESLKELEGELSKWAESLKQLQ
ncbi:MAG: valine--tRNA ligase [Candidatus Omnitrophota bacterium]|nr:valine--tRNA ligase [Candidatus Omnitrophota bacterium]